MITFDEPVRLNGPSILEKYIGYRNDWSAATKLTARKSVMLMMRWLGRRTLNVENVHAFAAWMIKHHEAPYAGRVLSHCRLFCQWLKQAGYIKEDPSEKITKPKQYTLPPKEGYSPDDYVRLRDNADPMMRTFVIVAFHTGLAQVDVCNLKWSDVRLTQMMVIKQRSKMAKRTGATQYVPIVADSDLHIELLRLRDKTYLGNEDNYVEPLLYNVYHNIGGSPAKDNGIIQRFEVLCRRARVVYRGTHGFRRGLLTAIASDPDVNLLHAANLSGHSNLQMLKRYVKPQPERIRASLEHILASHFAKVSLPLLPSDATKVNANVIPFPAGQVPTDRLLDPVEEESKADPDRPDRKGRGHVDQ